MSLLLETNLGGDLVIDLDLEGSPILCKNILKLAKIRYYTSTLLYNVQSTRFCQGGDPTGTGKGGACIHGVLTDDPSKRFLSSSLGRRLTLEECRQPGRLVALELDGKADTVGSQFLLTLGNGREGDGLDGYFTSGRHPLSLGTVAEDDDGVLEKIKNSYCDSEGRPYADIRILRMLVLHDPFPDPPGLLEYMRQQRDMELDESNSVVASPNPHKPLQETVADRIGVDQLDLKPEGQEETEEQMRERLEQEAKQQEHQRAVVLELLGDLPSADLKAPDNVLFICKLNPITEDEDLELIFSRFDPECKVEIIRDFETGKSLQYAFCEFSDKQQCVEAYFKMNNALVDDRRIKVDFSQSVAKLWNKHAQKLRMPKEPYDRNSNNIDNKRSHHERSHNNNHRYDNGHRDHLQSGRAHYRHDGNGHGDNGNRRDYDRNRHDRSNSERDRSHISEGRRGPDGGSPSRDDDRRGESRRRDGEDGRRSEKSSCRGKDEHYHRRHEDRSGDDSRSSGRRSRDIIGEEKRHRKKARERRRHDDDSLSFDDERKKKRKKKQSKEEKRKRKRHKSRHRYDDDETDDEEHDRRRGHNDREEEGRTRHKNDDRLEREGEHRGSDSEEGTGSLKEGSFQQHRNRGEYKKEKKSRHDKDRSGRKEEVFAVDNRLMPDRDANDYSPRDKSSREYQQSRREGRHAHDAWNRHGRRVQHDGEDEERHTNRSTARVEKPKAAQINGSDDRGRHESDRNSREKQDGQSSDDRSRGENESDRFSRRDHRRRHDGSGDRDDRRHHKHHRSDDEHRRRY